MDVKLGCLQSSYWDFIRSGIAKKSNYKCSDFSYPFPGYADDHYCVTCPICNLHIDITVIGRQRAEVEKAKSYRKGILIILPFIILIILDIIYTGFNVLLTLGLLLIAILLSSVHFYKAYMDGYYCESYTDSFNHKIFYK